MNDRITRWFSRSEWRYWNPIYWNSNRKPRWTKKVHWFWLSISNWHWYVDNIFTTYEDKELCIKFMKEKRNEFIETVACIIWISICLYTGYHFI